ncbi:MAG: hypothetical protein [Caudoviricetes sp.]|nr:MAG: hypothetical protein [Caudoviricetes sp.]
MILTLAFLFALAGNATMAWIFAWIALALNIINILLSVALKIADSAIDKMKD